MVSIVGVIGKKRAGKDSVAETLIGERGYTRFAFADPMKAAALALDPIVGGESTTAYDYGYGGELVECHGEPEFERLSAVVDRLGWEAAKEIPEVRRTLQRLGTEMGRGVFGDDFWVERTMRAIEASDRRRVVITDVRFPNEADAIRKAGGTLIRVVRPGQVSTDPHPSETALDGYDVPLVVLNAGTLDDLAETVRRLPL